jgi:hypothetical protein
MNEPDALKMIQDGPLNDYAGIYCPICGFEYNHVRRVYTRMGSDSCEAKVYEGTFASGSTEFRRSALVIEFDGECGHAWEFIIQQHKGNNLVDVVEIPTTFTFEDFDDSELV